MNELQTNGVGLKTTGAPSMEELHACVCYNLPGSDRTHPIAVIECIECIPCNPCETSCPQHAIHIGDEITNLPTLNMELCSGCGICVAACPGLAIYLKQKLHSQGLSLIAFPYEYYPLPIVGQAIEMVDREGTPICKGTVLKVILVKRNDKTAIIHAAYPQEFYEQVVNMQRLVRTS